MNQALLELMEPELRIRDEEKIKEGLHQGLRQGIQGTVDAFRKFGLGRAEIKKVIMEQYSISADEAEDFFRGHYC